MCSSLLGDFSKSDTIGISKGSGSFIQLLVSGEWDSFVRGLIKTHQLKYGKLPLCLGSEVLAWVQLEEAYCALALRKEHCICGLKDAFFCLGTIEATCNDATCNYQDQIKFLVAG